ncbi:MAG: PAS domain S-box protein [Nitrosomonadales bacterium]|nr:PAS domain S-box protein [Nitrosomonadales bacterium]
MTGSTEKLQRELQAAQRALAEAQARCERHDAEHQAATKELEDNRSALLFMLEDLEAARRKVEQAHREWMAALDVVEDPIFLHDREFRILRCNNAYRQCAGVSFKQIIGRPYYEVFPRGSAPLHSCLQAMENEETTEAEEEEMAVGDAVYRLRAFSIRDEQGAYLHSVHILEDITQRRCVESLLRESEQNYRTLADSSPALIWASGTDRLCNYFNRSWLEFTGRTLEQEMGNGWESGVHPDDLRHYLEAYVSAFDRRAPFSMEYRLRRHDGAYRWLRDDGCPRYNSDGNFTGYIGYLMDVTERKQAEQALRESEKLYRYLFENMMNGFAYCQMIFEQGQPQDFIYLSVNTAFETLTGLKNVVGKKISEVIPGIRQSDPELLEIYGRISLSGGPERFELYVKALQQWFWVSAYSPERGFFVAVFDVITERKKAEQALIESRQRTQHYLDVAGVMLVSLDTQGRVQMINRKGCEMLGYPETEILGKDWFDNYLPEPVVAEVRKAFNRIMGGDIAPIEYFENDILTAGGNVLAVAWHNASLFDEAGKISGVLSSGEDITARKAAEAATAHASRALATLSEVNRSLVRADSEDELLQSICRTIIKQRGYRLACVGYKQQDEDKSIKIMAHAGEGDGCTKVMQFTWAETEHGMGPSGRAIRSGKTQLSQNIANDPDCLPWQAAARQHGYAANLALPLLNDDSTVFGVLNVYAEEVNAFAAHEIELLEEMAGDLAFGVRTLHTRQERNLAMEQSRRHLEQLHDSLEDTVRAMAGLVEMRDPYTAGHQARVADLAMAIARQIGLPDELVHAVHLAGTVHDLGKIKVPAEILSKPGRITDIEFSLIKIHAQAGYDILKGINFPWPIAQMVLQHHERLDGSGYPQGLKGEQIILEARIISVADVVEAISAHRPYRPGLGAEAAMEEIIRGRGKHYDPQVVDACLALFREQHYSFKPVSPS